MIVLAIFIARTHQRSQDWRDNENLFKSGLLVNSNNVKLYYNLGQIYTTAGCYEKSITYNLKANEFQPNTSFGILTHLGNAYRHLGQTEHAIEYHKKAIDVKYVQE